MNFRVTFFVKYNIKKNSYLKRLIPRLLRFILFLKIIFDLFGSRKNPELELVPGALTLDVAPVNKIQAPQSGHICPFFAQPNSNAFLRNKNPKYYSRPRFLNSFPTSAQIFLSG